VASTSETIVAVAQYRVVRRSMAAGRSLAYEQLLAETATEVDVLLDERDARLRRRARKRILEDLARLAAAAESRAAADFEREFRSLLLDLPVGHPEHPENPESM
jgi:hypothetical protein